MSFLPSLCIMNFALCIILKRGKIMLIITRKEGESFLIGDNINITVLGVTGDKVKISIDAPIEIPVLRKELADAQSINKESASSDVSGINALKEKMHSEQVTGNR